MSRPKQNKKLQRQAIAAQEEANRVQKESMQAQENMRLNFAANSAANLNQSNLSNVVAGGTADAFGIDSSETQKKRRGAGGAGLASTLGITV
jgi:hypothetical protein